MQKSQFGEQIWQLFGEIFPEYIQKYGKLYTYYTTCICILSKNKRVYIHYIVEIYIHVYIPPVYIQLSIRTALVFFFVPPQTV